MSGGGGHAWADAGSTRRVPTHASTSAPVQRFTGTMTEAPAAA
jgi:hypothetical protein